MTTPCGPTVIKRVLGVVATAEHLPPKWGQFRLSYPEGSVLPPPAKGNGVRVAMVFRDKGLESPIVIPTLLRRRRWKHQAPPSVRLLAVFERRLPDSRNMPEFRRLVQEVFGPKDTTG